jgi:hypothetical protein
VHIHSRQSLGATHEGPTALFSAARKRWLRLLAAVDVRRRDRRALAERTTISDQVPMHTSLKNHDLRSDDVVRSPHIAAEAPTKPLDDEIEFALALAWWCW